MKAKHFVLSFCIVLSHCLVAQSPVAINGKLKLVGLQLSSECGNPVQLRGMSTHGIHYFQECYEIPELYDTLAQTWGVDVFRIANYIENGGYAAKPAFWKNWIDRWVDSVGKRGMYCIIDWHILDDGNPHENMALAKDFWDYMSKKHVGKKHVLYEICNEPNGRTVTWPIIKTYADTILSIIRKNDPETIVLVGTPTWSGNPWAVIGDELEDPNVMYTFHFYAGTHGFFLPDIKKAVSKIPIFASEWGTTASTGDGEVNASVTHQFMDIFNGNNDSSVLISWCNWSLSDKQEGSAALVPYACSDIDWKTSPSGTLVRSLLSSPPDRFYACTDKPQLFSDPRSAARLLGGAVSFNVIAKGIGLNYVWEKSTDKQTWAEIANSNTKNLELTNLALADSGYYRVKAFANTDTVVSLPAHLVVTAPGPFFGQPQSVPGVIEAETYDIGYPETAYSDDSEGNTGGAFRNDDVDVEVTQDTSGAYNVGWVENNEWLKYTVNVLDEGDYNFEFRVASNSATLGELTVEMNGEQVVSNTAIEPTGGWQEWTTVAVQKVPLKKGPQTMAINFLTGSFNLNFVNIRRDDPQGIASHALATHFALYPNPASSHLTINSTKFDLTSKKIALVNAFGQTVLETKAASKTVEVNVEHLPSGFYSLQIPIDGQQVYLKWIKQ